MLPVAHRGTNYGTLGFDKRWNPMLSRDRDALSEALAQVPPQPAEMERVLAFNRGHEEVGTRT